MGTEDGKLTIFLLQWVNPLYWHPKYILENDHVPVKYKPLFHQIQDDGDVTAKIRNDSSSYGSA